MNPKHLNLIQEAQRLDLAGRHGEALEAYWAYLALEPRDPGAWSDVGGLLMLLDRLEEAGKACRRALRIQPGHPSALVNLGCVLAREERFDEAEYHIRQAIARVPQNLDARQALSECLMRAGDLDRARVELERTLRMDPGNLSAHQALGHVFHQRGQWAEYRQELQRFRGVAPASPWLAFEQGFLDLLSGDFAAGWRGWEARLQVKGLVGPERTFPQPRWLGEPFPGRTLLLHHEQGFGDTLMFLRLARQARERGGRVVCEVQPELAALAATCPGVDEVVPHGRPLPPFDLQFPLLSLPGLLGLDASTLADQVPYLSIPADVPHRDGITEALDLDRVALRIGLVWAGSARHKNDRARSLPPGFLAPLAQLPEAMFCSFQLESREPCPLPGLVDLAPLLGDFSDTAFALNTMDLVVTVDTALAHLAGALGLPTFLLVPYGPDWRWMLDRDDSPWYPTMRLYRQPELGDWEAVIGRILQDLTAS